MKTVLVTGGARRIGRAVAVHLAESGFQVAVHVHESVAAGEQLVDELRQRHGHALLVKGDLSSESDCAQMVHELKAQVGQVAVLINCASTFTEDSVLSFPIEALVDHLKVNAFGPLVLSRLSVQQLATTCIVNFLDSRVVDYDALHASYHLSKRTFDAITRMLAMELAPQVRVNAVAPGLILPPEGKGDEYVEMRKKEIPLQRQGTLADICQAVDFLINSGFVTGQTLFVDGGRHLKGAFYQ
ncbi:MAG: SDR family oxidoreductase [Deltaproteobacteria bacterium]|nr:SDR family oxidoreductase [Deltaproteobacteria bacterium]